MKDVLKFFVFGGLFAVPFLVLYVENDFFFPFITGKNFAFRIIVEIAAAAWVLLALLDKDYRPRFSWVLGGFLALLGVMFFANLFGEYPLKSFWSNFERMDGYVTLVHVFLYFIVAASSMRTEKIWIRFFNVSIFAAILLTFYAFGQISGAIDHRYGGFRVDATLGNATYMAIYMLFHVFIAGLLFVKTESRYLKYFYGGLIFLFGYLLIQTATRGTTLGLLGGVSVSVIYIALFGKGYDMIRKIAIGAIIAIVVFVGLFVGFSQSPIIQDNPTLNRLSQLSLDEATTRFAVWSISFEGIKERPILGWGQGNYNYVFNEHYDPSLYAQESWFDRVHNIFLDWLIAGGILGLLAYLAVLFAALYYAVARPLINRFTKKDDSKEGTFAVLEQGVILGLLAGYVFHNLFVFDNIVSYIFYAVILAYIHARVAWPVATIEKFTIDRKIVEQVVTPVVVVILAATLYFVNIPGIQAAGDIIDAFTSRSADEMVQEFEDALSRNSFGNQEIREQLTRQTQNVLRAQGVSQELKDNLFLRTEEELLKQIEEKPGDARVHVFISSFYRMTGNVDDAIEQLEIALSLSPRKQQIMFEQGLAHIQKEEFDTALEIFKRAHELDTRYREARVFYAVAALYANQPEIVEQVITEKYVYGFVRNDLAVQAAYQNDLQDMLVWIFSERIRISPTDPQIRVNLAVIHQEAGDLETAITILEEAGEDIPSFKAQADGFIEDLKAGNAPGSGS